MTQRFGAAVAFAGILAATPCAAQVPPLEAFAQLPSVSQLQLSPDGRHLAAIRSFDGHLTPLIYRTDALDDDHPIVLPTADWTIDSFVWANNTRLIMVVKKTYRGPGDSMARPWLRAIAVNLDGSHPIVLLSKQRGYGNNQLAADIVSVDLSDPDHAYAALNVPDISSLPSRLSLGHFEKVTYRLDLMKVDVNTGDSVAVAHGEHTTSMWLMDGHAHVVARIDQDIHPLVEHVMVPRETRWVEIARYDAASTHGANIIGLNMDGTALVRLDTIARTGTRGLSQIALADGKTSVLFADPHYDVGHPQTEPWTGRIVGVSVVEDQEKYRFFDPQMQSLQDGLEAAFPGASVLAASWDATLTKVIVEVSGTRQPPAFYLVNRMTHKADKLGDTYPDLNEAALGEIKPYPYTSRDGLDIHAYLTLPPGKPAKNLPTVIFPHGGPGERDEMQFVWLAQFLATQGYAVLQPNFRGSSGYGTRFKEAGYGQWGLKMQDDVTDGVKKLIADGVADPKRVCIVGASYGGFAALAGAAFTPDLYACAASWAGVTDQRTFLASRAEDYGYDSAAYSSWARIVGGNSGSGASFEATSPTRNAGRIKCPILLMHGSADTAVRIDQSVEMADALHSAGKAVEFIRFDGETHTMDSSATRARVLRELQKFLAANIGN